MSKENAVTLDLDAMFPGDGLDVEENVISDAYWALECEELAVIAHIYRYFDEARGAIIPERCHWYFNDGRLRFEFFDLMGRKCSVEQGFRPDSLFAA
jgi:hypothetical protein